MSSITINLDNDALTPGARVQAQVSWTLQERADRVAVKLIWYTEGKGTEDLGLIDSEIIEDAGTSGNTVVSLQCPDFPYSFSGTLISLHYAVEAVTEPPQAVQQAPLVIAPNATEIAL
ncbi:MAG: hypothetical protein PF961_07845 [Planctomycetota bacterium]|jgi:hypothetical protein|nr:hypothetical protein [Planctomycetota bacterium]